MKSGARHAVIEYPALCLLIIILSDYLRITISICKHVYVYAYLCIFFFLCKF